MVALAEYGHQRGSHVLIAAANQGAAFCFRIAGRRKAPDLVLYNHGTLYLIEAKVRARDLVASTAGRLSDLECLGLLLSSPKELRKLKEEAAARLLANTGSVPSSFRLACGVASADTLHPYASMLTNVGVLGIHVPSVSKAPKLQVKTASPTPLFD